MTPFLTPPLRTHCVRTAKLIAAIVAVTTVVASLCAPVAQAQTFRVYSSLFDEYDVSPGSQHRGQFDVVNEGNAPLTVKVIRQDVRFYADGKLLSEEPGAHERSNANWITLEQDRLTIAPNARETFYYDISVPSGVTDGSYWSALVVQNDLDQEIAFAERAAIRQRVKVYVQVATHVGQALRPEVSFLSTEIVEDADGQRKLDIRIENTGNRSDIVPVWAELYDGNGQLATRVEGRSGVVHPGTSVRQVLDLGEVPSGEYNAIIVAEPIHGDAYGTRLTLSL
jgi:hypothetical protein